MSYRTLQETDGLASAMSLFAPAINIPLQDRVSTTLGKFNNTPSSPEDWGNYDVCGGSKPEGIPAALFNATFDEQITLKDGGVTKWDESGKAFNSALFPVVVRWTSGERARKATKFNEAVEDTSESHAFPVIYRACWSQFKPNKGVEIPHEPKFEEIKLHEVNERGVAIEGSYRYSVFVDAALIGDIHCARSIVASLENSSVAPRSYIYFFPDVTKRVRENPAYPFDKPDDHKISGASLGMAIYAAVSGWPSILYTGYTSFILPGFKIQNASEYSEKTSDIKNKYWNGAAPQSFTNKNVTTYGQAYVEVGKQIDFVDSVQDLPYKMILAVFHKIPIIIPMTTALNTSAASYVGQANAKWRQSLLNFYQLTYTMANQEAGLPTVITDGNNKYARMLYMGKTIGEFMVLAFLAANAQAVTKLTAEKELKRVNKYVNEFETVWTDRRIQQGTNMANRAKILRDEKGALKEALDNDEITPQQWIEKTQANQAKRLQAKKVKKAAAKVATKQKEAKRSEVKEKIDAALEAYKDQYHAAKAALGPKPTAKAKREFNQEWPSLLTAKKRMNKEALKKVIGTELVQARQQQNPTLRFAQRYSSAEKIAPVVPDATALINILNSMYPADKIAPIEQVPGEKTSQDVLNRLREQITGMVSSARQAALRQNPNLPGSTLPDTLLRNQALARRARERAAFLQQQNQQQGGNENDDEQPLVTPKREKQNQDDNDVEEVGRPLGGTAPKRVWNVGDIVSMPQLGQNDSTVETDVNGNVISVDGRKATQLDDGNIRIDATSKFRGFDNKSGRPYGNKTKWDASATAGFGNEGQMLQKLAAASAMRKKMEELMKNRSLSAGSHFGASSNKRGPSTTYTGVGRIQPRRIINRPQNDADMDMTAWNPFSFIKDVGEGIVDGIETAGRVVGAVAKHAAPIVGAAAQVARALQ